MTGPSQSVGSFSFYRRILVTGANGAGKTWFAQRLAQMLDLPVVHNDALALGTGWNYLPADQIAAAQRAVLAEDAWVHEGGASLVRADVLGRAQVVVWLDPPAHLRVWRIARRSVRFLGRTRPEHPEGNVEWPGRRQVRFAVKAWQNDAAVRAAIEAGLAGQACHVVRLRAPQAVRDFLRA